MLGERMELVAPKCCVDSERTGAPVNAFLGTPAPSCRSNVLALKPLRPV